jgi:ComF family protein
MGEGAVCGACAAQPPSWDQARSVLRYDRHSRRLVLMLKHGDQTHLVGAFGRWMYRAGGEVLAGADILVPVPLHWTRLFTRRYNQAAVLAHEIGKASGIRVSADLLQRNRATPSQGRQNRVERKRNVAGAFAVKRGRNAKGMRVLLIDDVLTTGATAAECARVLLKAGAERVEVLTLARTARPEN